MQPVKSSVLCSAPFSLDDPLLIVILQVNFPVYGIILKLFILHSFLVWLNIVGFIEDIDNSNSDFDFLAFKSSTYYAQSDRTLYLLNYREHTILITVHLDIFYQALGIFLLSKQNMSVIHYFEDLIEQMIPFPLGHFLEIE